MALLAVNQLRTSFATAGGSVTVLDEICSLSRLGRHLEWSASLEAESRCSRYSIIGLLSPFRAD